MFLQLCTHSTFGLASRILCVTSTKVIPLVRIGCWASSNFVAPCMATFSRSPHVVVNLANVQSVEKDSLELKTVICYHLCNSGPVGLLHIITVGDWHFVKSL